jgi:putative ABC transport system permease protein
MSFIALDYFDLGVTACLVLALALLTRRLALGVASGLLVAALRTVVQLMLVGLVLKVLFANVHLAWVLAMAAVMLLAAGREVMARQKRQFAGPWRYGLGTGSMFVSSFTVTVFALVAVIGPQPWYAPQYSIPLLGMLLGNTMTSVALALDRLKESAWEQRRAIEARLSLGEAATAAIGDIRRDCMRVGMLPIINAMAAAGIVSLPGMMTGQILAGAPPLDAVKYQILIMFLITAGTGFGTIVAVWYGANRLFDERQRLRLDRLTSRA